MESSADTGPWRKSSFSYPNGDCVEVAAGSSGIHIRDSKHTDGPRLMFSSSEWRAFVRGVKNGEFDFHLHRGAE